MNELVSIVVPAYNSSGFIAQAIESVLKQHYVTWELIVVDDCSTDSTVDIVTGYAKEHSNIRLFTTGLNSGAGVARNIGIENAKGRYLAFLDSDDVWRKDKLSKQIDFMNATGAAISHTSFGFVDEYGCIRRGSVHVSSKVNLEHNLKKTEIGTSTAIIDRKKFDKPIRFDEIRARQDLKLWISLLSIGCLSYGLDETLVSYRVRPNSVSSNKVKMLWITLKVYLSISSLSYTKRLYCYGCYVVNAIRKRR